MRQCFPLFGERISRSQGQVSLSSLNAAKRNAGGAVTRKLADLLDLIYHAAIDSDGWNPLLRRLASMTDCTAAGITIEHPVSGRGRPITYFGFDTGHVQRAFDHYLPMNPLFKVSRSMTTGFIVANGDVIAPRDFVMTDFYNGWARPQGIGSPLTLVLDHDATFYCPLTLVRPDGKGEALPTHRKLLRTLSPHLTRAMKVHLRLETAHARLEATDAVFENAALAVFLLDAAGRVIFCNRRAEGYLQDGAVLAAEGGALTATDARQDLLLQHALSRASASTAPSGTELTITGYNQSKLALSVTPVPAAGPTAFYGKSRVCCAVMVSDPHVRHASTVRKLAQTHGLTQAEMRVLDVMLTGAGSVQAAADLGISAETARTHLKRIFSKTGTNRQAELMRLFMDVALRNRL
jgi:DNA-binding CsgD family transcriptional regulator/PAS domain-containing protein